MLSIKQLHVSVEQKEILKGVDLEIHSGEIHAIMGPNGGGKSTLAYALSGHPKYVVSKGFVDIDGKDLLLMPADERARSGLFLAFQYPVEVSGVSVQNFLRVAFEARFGQIKSILKFRQNLQKQADKLGILPEFLSRGLNEGFSGGEKKRVEILQMETLKPTYAILDETDSGLDVDAIKVVSKGVRNIVKKYNTGIIVITHYQRILKYLKPDYVHVMVDGKIVKSGGKELSKELEATGYEQLKGNI